MTSSCVKSVKNVFWVTYTAVVSDIVDMPVLCFLPTINRIILLKFDWYFNLHSSTILYKQTLFLLSFVPIWTLYGFINAPVLHIACTNIWHSCCHDAYWYDWSGIVLIFRDCVCWRTYHTYNQSPVWWHALIARGPYIMRIYEAYFHVSWIKDDTVLRWQISLCVMCSQKRIAVRATQINRVSVAIKRVRS